MQKCTNSTQPLPLQMPTRFGPPALLPSCSHSVNRKIGLHFCCPAISSRTHLKGRVARPLELISGNRMFSMHNRACLACAQSMNSSIPTGVIGTCPHCRGGMLQQLQVHGTLAECQHQARCLACRVPYRHDQVRAGACSEAPQPFWLCGSGSKKMCQKVIDKTPHLSSPEVSQVKTLMKYPIMSLGAQKNLSRRVEWNNEHASLGFKLFLLALYLSLQP